jgi:hypothetical protein
MHANARSTNANHNRAGKYIEPAIKAGSMREGEGVKRVRRFTGLGESIGVSGAMLSKT